MDQLTETMATAVESVEAVVAELKTARKTKPGNFNKGRKGAPDGDGYAIGTKLLGKLKSAVGELEKMVR